MPTNTDVYTITSINRGTGTVTLVSNRHYHARSINVGRDEVYNYSIGMEFSLTEGQLYNIGLYDTQLRNQELSDAQQLPQPTVRPSQALITELYRPNWLSYTHSWIDAFLPATHRPALSIEHIRAWGDKWVNMWARVAEGHELRIYCKEIELKDGKFVELRRPVKPQFFQEMPQTGGVQ